ncbi:MAG: hypothetical protein DIJKHBIC_00024 [Thermoanaerobaculia bacterium]|nr:hypothetical protein [Thermoanaerobaculia bacterium]
MSEEKDWLRANMQDEEFRVLLAREGVIEGFLLAVEREMDKKGVTRSALARKMGCSAANITRIMRRSSNLTVESMVDIAYFLGMRLEISLAPARVEPPKKETRFEDFDASVPVEGTDAFSDCPELAA